MRHPTGNRPQSVTILACGPTLQTYNGLMFDYDPRIPPADEVWTLNKALRTMRCDMGFVMDDMAGEAARSVRYADDLRGLKVPIMTSIVDETVMNLYPGLDLHAFPLRELLVKVGARVQAQQDPDSHVTTDRLLELGQNTAYYLHNSVPYMLAYAWLIGVRVINLFGADYTFPGTDAREDDRACCEYWIGLLRAWGVEVRVSEDTTLLSQRRQPWAYGYGARQPMIAQWSEQDPKWVREALGYGPD